MALRVLKKESVESAQSVDDYFIASNHTFSSAARILSVNQLSASQMSG